MYEHGESIPLTDNDQLFPIGDISTHAKAKAESFLSQLQATSPGRLPDDLGLYHEAEVGYWVRLPGQKDIWRDLRYLAEEWGDEVMPESPENQEHGQRMVTFGVGYSIMFLKKTCVLPVLFEAETKDIEALGDKSKQQVEEFVTNGWIDMELSHGRLHNVLFEYRNLLVEAVGIDDDKSLLLLDAGMIVPYLIAVNTELKKAMSKSFEQKSPEVMSKAQREVVRQALKQ